MTLFILSGCLLAWTVSAEPTGGLNVAEFAIPPSLGKIQDRFTGTSPRTVIHIQDVHQHLTAQENIAAIVEHLSTLYGIKTIALEGGWSETNLPRSRSLPNSREKQTLARVLLEDGHLTGPPYAALFSQTPIDLVGMEDKDLYEANRQVYLRHLAGRQETLTRIESLEKKYVEKKKQLFNPDLQDFDNALNQFRQGKEAENFLPLLLSLSETKGADLRDLTQVDLFRRALEMEQNLDKKGLESETLRLVEAFKDTQMNLEELLLSGRVPVKQLENYPEAKKYLELLKLQTRISHSEFFRELERAIQRLKEKLFVSEEEQALDESWQRFLLAKKLLLLQATPEDLRSYESQKAPLESEMTQEGLGEALKLALDFYELARKRDEIFFQKITTDPRLAGDIIVVSGGFHTEGLTEKLRQVGITFAVIAPDLANQPANETLYFKRLQDPIRPSQTLSDIDDRFLRPEFDPGFEEGVETLRKTHNLKDAENVVLVAIGIVTPASPSKGRSSTQFFQNFSPDHFLSLPPANQKEQVKKWLQMAGEGKLPIVILMKTSDAMKLFKDDVGLTLWRNVIAPDRANAIAEIRDNEEYLSEFLGIKARVIRISLKGNETIDDIIDKRFKAEKIKRAIAVINQEYRANEWVLGLPVEPVSLWIARLALEHGFPTNLSAEFRASLNDLLKQIFLEEGSLARAA